MDGLSYWQSQLTNTDGLQYPTSSLRKMLLFFVSAKLSPDLVLTSPPAVIALFNFVQSNLCSSKHIDTQPFGRTMHLQITNGGGTL